jgi:hypothetical protein
VAKRFAIKGRNGDYRYFSTSPDESKRRFLDSKPFGTEWHECRNQGVSLVQVDIREVAIIDGRESSQK